MSAEIECTTRQWGSSLGVIIPKGVVDAEHIRPNEKIRITLQKTILAQDIWDIGPIKSTESTQDIIDELKKGW